MSTYIKILALSLLSLLSYSGCMKNPEDVSGIIVSGVPVLSSTSVSGVSYNAANFKSKVLSNSKWKYDIDERGFVLSATSNMPTYGANEVKIKCQMGFGEFIGNATKLATSKTYYVRSYAVSGKNIGYGELVTFKTKDN